MTALLSPTFERSNVPTLLRYHEIRSILLLRASISDLILLRQICGLTEARLTYLLLDSKQICPKSLSAPVAITNCTK